MDVNLYANKYPTLEEKRKINEKKFGYINYYIYLCLNQLK